MLNIQSGAEGMKNEILNLGVVDVEIGRFSTSLNSSFFHAESVM